MCEENNASLHTGGGLVFLVNIFEIWMRCVSPYENLVDICVLVLRIAVRVLRLALKDYRI